MATIKVSMICNKCGIEFTRSKARMNNHSLCKKCKFEETYASKRKTGETLLIYEKRKQTVLKTYGVENIAQSKEATKKASSTKLDRYGYVGHFQKPDVQVELQEKAHTNESYSKKRATCVEKFGVDHYMRSADNIKDHKEKIRLKTGYDNPMRNPEIKKKIVEEYGKIGQVKGYTYKDIHFDSSWELAMYIWLTDSKKQFIYHPAIPFTYIGDDGMEHQGYPDFLIEGKFVEIKGTQFFNENHEPFNRYTQKFWWGKYQAMKENNIEILEQSDIKPYLEYVKVTYGKDFLKKHKNP
jgi:hypothetical protein